MTKVIFLIILSLFISITISYLRFVNKGIGDFFRPIIVFFKSAPLAILIVYFFFLFGSKIGPYIICFVMLEPIIIDALFEAQDNIDSYVMLDLKTHNISNIKKYFKIIFPLMLPYLEMSIIMSFGLGFKVIVMGEYMMQSPSSLGLLIYYKKANIEIEYLLAILIAFTIFVLVFELVLKLIFKILKIKLYGKTFS